MPQQSLLYRVKGKGYEALSLIGVYDSTVWMCVQSILHKNLSGDMISYINMGTWFSKPYFSRKMKNVSYRTAAVNLLMLHVYKDTVFVQFQVESYWSFAMLLIGNAMCQIFPTSSVSSVQDDTVVACSPGRIVHDFWLIKGSVGIDLFRGSRNSSVGMDSFV